MAVNGRAITGPKSGEARLMSLLPAPCSDSFASAYSYLSGTTFDVSSREPERQELQRESRHLRQCNVQPDAGSSTSSTASSLSSEDAMNMRFADLTHMQLKKSIDQVHGLYSGTASDHSEKQTARRISSSPNGTCGSGSNEGLLTRNIPSLSRYSATDISPRSHPGSLVPMNSSSALTTKIMPSSSSGISKFQSLLSVKDALLEEKESAIRKLRTQVSSLQHQIEDSNSASRQLLQDREKGMTLSITSPSLNGRPRNDDLPKGIEYEESNMRIHLAESFAHQNKDVNDLQSLLAKTEYQLADARSKHACERRVLANKVKELEFCLRTKDKSICEGKRKQKSLCDRIEKYKRRVESLERYLGGLPTMEESSEVKRSVTSLTSDNEKLAGELEQLREKHEDVVSRLQKKDECLRAEIEKNIHMKDENRKYSSRIINLERAQDELGVTERREFEEATRELQQMHRGREDAAKLLTAADTRIKTLTTQHREEINKLQERIEQEENATQALKRELVCKQQTSAKVQSAMTKLASQNQQLMEEKMTFLEQLRALESERSSSRDALRVTARLHCETEIAIRDLKAVAKVLVQMSRGEDPNLSALLGVRPSSVGLTDEESVDSDNVPTISVEVATRKLTDVRKLRRDVDELRSTLSNQYAENIGQNCATQ